MFKTIDLAFIYQTFGYTLTSANCPTRIITDSRQIQAGDTFVALIGEHFDAHNFIDEVQQKGASLCLVSDEYYAQRTGCLKVNDTTLALARLAEQWRLAQPHIHVIGITGSSGKTTVKEMTASILRAYAGDQAVLSTIGNLNNHLGVPLTLLRLNSDHQFAVIEMGMNHAGELATLTRIAHPEISLINNALQAHIGCGFTSTTDIARAKSEIYQGLPENGIAVYRADDPHKLIFQQASLHLSQRCFALENAPIHAQNIQLYPTYSEFDLCLPNQQNIHIHLPTPGKHNINNALASVSLCLDFVDTKAIQIGLAHYKSVGSRLKFIELPSGTRIIDDSYNANPDSMRASIDVLANFPAPRIFVMGDMGELGDFAPKLHYEVGAYAKQKGIEYALFIGQNCQQSAQAFGENALYFKDKHTLTNTLNSLLTPQTTVLIKGSRFMKMEEIIPNLQ